MRKPREIVISDIIKIEHPQTPRSTLNSPSYTIGAGNLHLDLVEKDMEDGKAQLIF
jgi:hypothetical protein